jgi:hypothetical protein
MSRRVRALVPALVLAVVLAGCLGPVFGNPGSDNRPSSGIAPSDTTRLDSEQDGGDDGRSSRRRSPWGSDPVVVAVDSRSDRNVVPLVRRAAAYWETNAEQYAGYTIDYEVVPNATQPDIVIRFDEVITGCERTRRTAGCAPYITHPAQVDRPATVEVKTGLSDESTVLVLAHEFGHTLGLGHDDAPQAVMRTGLPLTTLPQSNATERGFAWTDSEFTVYVDVAAAPDPDAAREQVQRALDYYERGALGTPNNLTFRAVDDPDAELVVRYVDRSACTRGVGSCGSSRGPDPDGDGASERYSQFTVTVVGVDTDAVGWHTGYWLASAFGLPDDAEKPPPFRNASYQERRSEWWE